MKTQVFKNLIKEAVKEALQEMLFQEEKKPAVQKEAFKTNGVEKTTPITSQYRASTPTDPITEMLNMTKASMKREDFRNIVGESSIQGFNPNSFQVAQDNTPAPGLDISSLDFVKNAGAVYKASLEKDKARGI